MNIMRKRKEIGAICDVCRSPDYSYYGRACGHFGSHQFKCNSCGNWWCYGRGKSIYTKYCDMSKPKSIWKTSKPKPSKEALKILG